MTKTAPCPSGANYSDLNLHRVMLRDEVRDESFRKALQKCVGPGSVVLDVGTGTGILSVFAAQAGARKVYSVEPTPAADFAEKVIAENNMADRIELIRGAIEDIEVRERVDVIVFEWLGACGNDENMYRLLLTARDRWLKPGGTIVPGNTTAWMAPAHDKELSTQRGFFLGKPFGVELSSIWTSTSEELFYGRHHLAIDDLLAEPQALWTHDVAADTVERANADYEAKAVFTVAGKGTFNGLATWFTADMPHGEPLTNAPDALPTHWGRLVFPCLNEYRVVPGQKIEVAFTSRPGGTGWCRGGWSIRVDGNPWEHHLDHRK